MSLFLLTLLLLALLFKPWPNLRFFHSPVFHIAHSFFSYSYDVYLGDCIKLLPVLSALFSQSIVW